MEDLQKVADALNVVERYSDYLARRAWGKTLIIWGIMAPIGLVLYFNRTTLSNLINMSVESFTFLSSTIVVLIGMGFTLYNFLSVSRLITDKEKQIKSSEKGSSLHGILIGSIWFLLFIFASFIPDPFSVISSIWAAGLAIIISFWLMKNYFHGSFPEFLLVGIILLIASIPLIFLIIIKVDLSLVQTLAVIIYSISFLSGGFYSLTIATDILSRN